MLFMTKSGVIRSDRQGDGHYLAKRGNRLHLGIDYEIKPFEEVYAPFDCYIVRIAKPYANEHYSGLVLQSKYFAIKSFYFEPIMDLIRTNVKAGTIIGYAQDIANKYNVNKKEEDKMDNHIHVEVDNMDISIIMGKL